MKDLVKEEKKLSQKFYPTNHNLLTVRDLWQVHYQIFLIILPKEFIKLNANMDMMMKNVKKCRSKHKDCKHYLEYVSVKNNLIAYKCFCCNINYQK